jgi:hypothetical protein
LDQPVALPFVYASPRRFVRRHAKAQQRF